MIYFLQKSCKKWVKETSSRPIFVFWKRFILGKCKWCAASFPYISIALKLAYNENELYKTWDFWSRDMLNFDFSEKDLEIVSSPNFMYGFSTKMFLLYSVNSPNFMVWLPFWRYWEIICISQLLVNQVLMS